MRKINIYKRELHNGEVIIYNRRDGRIFVLEILDITEIPPKLHDVKYYNCKVLDCTDGNYIKKGEVVIFTPGEIRKSETVYLLDKYEAGLYKL